MTDTTQTTDTPLPVTLDADRTPVDAQGRYVPHFRDEADTVHFFAVVERPPDSPLPEIAAHELRYFRVPPGEEAQIAASQPVMPVNDPATSPWPLPALAWYLEEGDLAAAQALARDTAEQFSLPRTPDSGWYHFDTALVAAPPQGAADGTSVGVVDVYANHENGGWAARYLPLGEFDTRDEALAYQQDTLLTRLSEDRTSAFAPAGLQRQPGDLRAHRAGRSRRRADRPARTARRAAPARLRRRRRARLGAAHRAGMGRLSRPRAES